MGGFVSAKLCSAMNKASESSGGRSLPPVSVRFTFARLGVTYFVPYTRTYSGAHQAGALLGRTILHKSEFHDVPFKKCVEEVVV